MPLKELDCLGLACPMPIVKISRAIKELAAGDDLRVQADDPSFRADLQAWLTKMGHLLQSFEVVGKVQTAVVRKKG